MLYAKCIQLKKNVKVLLKENTEHGLPEARVEEWTRYETTGRQWCLGIGWRGEDGEKLMGVEYSGEVTKMTF